MKASKFTILCAFVLCSLGLLSGASPADDAARNQELNHQRLVENIKYNLDVIHGYSSQPNQRSQHSHLEPQDYYRMKNTAGEPTKAESIDLSFDFIFAFLDGWNLDSFVAYTDNCWESLYIMTVDWNDMIQESWCEECTPVNPTGTFDTYIYNTTDLISGVTADAVYECYNWGVGWYYYGLEQKALYPDAVEFGYAFLQNMIGGILTYTDIYNKLVEASANEDYVSTAKYIGAIFYQLMSFEPIETSANPIESYVREQQLLQQVPQREPIKLMEPIEFKLKIEEEMNARHADHPLLTEDPTWNTYLEMTYLILNTTLGPTSPNSTVCVGNWTSLIESSAEIGIYFDNFLYEEAGDLIYDMMTSLDPIIYSCWTMLFEFYWTFLAYGETFTNPVEIAYNLVDNFGQIYDDIEQLVLICSDPDYDPAELVLQIGYLSGELFYLIFMYPTDYITFDQLIEQIQQEQAAAADESIGDEEDPLLT